MENEYYEPPSELDKLLKNNGDMFGLYWGTVQEYIKEKEGNEKDHIKYEFYVLRQIMDTLEYIARELDGVYGAIDGVGSAVDDVKTMLEERD